MKKLLILSIGFLFIAFSASAQKQNRKQTKECCSVAAKTHHRVLIHLASGDADAHKGLINQLTGLKEAFGDSVEIEVVVHGPGLDFAMTAKTTQKENIHKAVADGVKFYVCENTMKYKKITKEEILPEMGFVKFAMAEIVQKQEEGWTYIKTGF
ncbi:MAG: DsrE family protein [Chitinophagales bacterium]|nr:DsrE family protein [Chitinophagales bacterium]